MTHTIQRDDIWRALDQVKDPEIPPVSLVEMGIVRDVAIANDTVTVVMTPTFSGCPALSTMRHDIESALHALGFARVRVEIQLSPAWSSDWITPAAREKLRQFGLAPPRVHGGDINVMLMDEAVCPYCNSHNTVVKNTFGPTLCRAIYFCNDCKQPFEQFKPI